MQHLANCLKEMLNREDKEGAHKIMAIIQWEKDLSFWWCLKFALRKHVLRQSVQSVQFQDKAGRVTQFDTEKGVQEEAIFNKVHCKW